MVHFVRDLDVKGSSVRGTQEGTVVLTAPKSPHKKSREGVASLRVAHNTPSTPPCHLQ